MCLYGVRGLFVLFYALGKQLLVFISFLLGDVCLALISGYLKALWPWFLQKIIILYIIWFFHVIKWRVIFFAAFYTVSEFYLSNFHSYSLFFPDFV